jgi:hypothetical protein
MNRACILATLALTLTGGSVSHATEKPQAAPPASAVLENAPKGTVVFDDDGGRAQIIPRAVALRNAVAERDATFHGGPVVSGASVQAVFLGSGWREGANRRKESDVLKALRSQGSADAKSLSWYGVKAWEAPETAIEDPAGDPVADKRRISDLDIQARLDGLLGGAGPVDASSVYLVFLAPDLESKLGAKTSARDYAAYHNHFHSAAGVIHYVVVPYDGDPSRWVSAARQSLRQALINPEGNGWY